MKRFIAAALLFWVSFANADDEETRACKSEEPATVGIEGITVGELPGLNTMVIIMRSSTMVLQPKAFVGIQVVDCTRSGKYTDVLFTPAEDKEGVDSYVVQVARSFLVQDLDNIARVAIGHACNINSLIIDGPNAAPTTEKVEKLSICIDSIEQMLFEPVEQPEEMGKRDSPKQYF